MHQPRLVDYRVLVGVVAGAGTDQLRDERALAGMRTSGEKNRAAAPPDDAGMDEEVRARADSDREVQLAFDRLEKRVEVVALGDLAVVLEGDMRLLIVSAEKKRVGDVAG